MDNLDALLEEIKGYNISEKSFQATEKKESGNWSLDDIDALIAEFEPVPAEKTDDIPSKVPEENTVKEEYTAKEPVAFPGEDVPVDSYFKKGAVPETTLISAKEPDISADESIDSVIDELSIDDIDSLVESVLGELGVFDNGSEISGSGQESFTQAETVLTDEKSKQISDEESLSDNDVIKTVDEDDSAKKPMGEIREFPNKIHTVKKVDNFVINEFTEPEVAEEEDIDPDKIPDYDPLADYEAYQKASEQAGMETDETRESFLKPLELDDEPTEVDNDFLEPFDKPGILLKKNQMQMTSDLEPLPVVISADKAKADAKTKVISMQKKAEVSVPTEEEFPGQIKLSGFEEIPEETKPETTDEHEMEAKLFESRRHKAKEFRLSPDVQITDDDMPQSISLDDIPDIEPVVPKKSTEKSKKKVEVKKRPDSRLPEYNELADRRNVHAALNALSLNNLKLAFIDFVFELVLLVFGIIAHFASGGSFCSGGVGNYIVNAVVLIAAMVLNSKTLLSGISALRERRADASSAAALVALVAFVHTTVSAAVEVRSGGSTPAFAMIGVLALGMINAAEYINARRMQRNFELCAYQYEKNLYTIHYFEDETELRELGRGIMLDQADLLYSSKTEFPLGFVENSGNSIAECRAVAKVLPMAVIAAVVTGIISAFVSREPLAAFTAACAAFCICSPVFASFIPAVAVARVNKSVNSDGALIMGLDSAEEFLNTNAIVIDSGDIFNRSKCRMHGMVDFKQIRIDDVLVYAAALVIKSGGPLRECFEDVISEDHNLLPTVRELAYEDKLGVSARIHSQKVLLGNRTLLENHNVEVPDKSLEEKYARSGKRVVFLAVGGRLAAMFVVSYAVDLRLKASLEKLDDAGTQVIVRTNDVNITEELLSRGFGIRKNMFSILSSVGGRLFVRRRDEISPSAPVKLAHNGNAFSMLRAVSAAQQLCKNSDFSVAFQIALCTIGFIASAIITATAGSFGAITSFVFAALCGVVSYIITYFINGRD